MHKLVLQEVVLDLKKGSEFEIDIQSDAIVKATLIQLQPKSVLAISSTSNPEQNYDLVPVVVFLINPDSPKVKQKYFILTPNTVATANEGFDLQYCGTFIHPKGLLLHLIQEVKIT